MVSLHKALTESPKSQGNIGEFEASTKKRSWEEALTKEFFKDHTDHAVEKIKPIFDIELHLKTPLPSDKWQQYLNIQSGQIHLCNTRMSMKIPDSQSCCGPQFKTLMPEPEEAYLGQMSLDLELNLACESVKKKKKEENHDMMSLKKNSSSPAAILGGGGCDLLINESSKNKKDSCVLAQTPSWLSSESDHSEMIAAVCMKCHLLVMLCKSSPSCPNCKFMHPPDQSPSQFLKRRRFSLLC